MNNFIRDFNLAKKIALEIKKEGGKAYIVGGYVRDLHFNKENKDLDIEVYNISFDKLKEILSKYGIVDIVGASFGVLKIHGIDIDWSMPRLEKKIGEGHKGFKIEVNPFCDYKTACQRRDFTINAMMQDIITEEILDPFNGKKDIEKRILRCVDINRFGEDPLRVFRAGQIAARFELQVDINTIEIMKKIDVSTLPKERLYSEYQKLLLKSENPSIGLNILKEVGVLPKELLDISDLYWKDLMNILDLGAKLKISNNEKEILMWSLLLHSLGDSEEKMILNDSNELSSSLSLKVMRRITNESKLLHTIPLYIKNCMKPIELWEKNASKSDYLKLMTVIPNFETLLLICKSVISVKNKEIDFCIVEKDIKSILGSIEKPPKKIITGKDLITLDYKPSHLFTEILNWAYIKQLEIMEEDNSEEYYKQILIEEIKNKFK